MTWRSAAIATAKGRSPVRTAIRSTLSPFRNSARGAASHPFGTAMAHVETERRCASDRLRVSSAVRSGAATNVDAIEAISNVVPAAEIRIRRFD